MKEEQLKNVDGVLNYQEYCPETKRVFDNYLEDDYYLLKILSDEVIIEDTPKEDKKIEKIKDYKIFKTMGLDCKYNNRKVPKEYSFEEKEMVEKINEIIDKVNGE